MSTNTVTPATPARPILKPEGLLSSSVSGETSAPSSSSSRRRIVSFDRVTIREFAYDIGDHPWTSEGIPISISWDHQDETTVQLDLYETRKCSPPGFPPNVLSTQQRRDILIRAGYSHLDLQEAQGELDRVRKEGRCSSTAPPSRQRGSTLWRIRGLPMMPRVRRQTMSLRTGSRSRRIAAS